MNKILFKIMVAKTEYYYVIAYNPNEAIAILKSHLEKYKHIAQIGIIINEKIDYTMINDIEFIASEKNEHLVMSL